MKIVWIEGDAPFPNAGSALAEPAGLLAAGGDLSVRRLIQAYSSGIFPWFNEGEPILWWSPDPRMILECIRFAPGRALRKKLRQLARSEALPPAALPDLWEVRVDTAFDRVIAACARPRDGAPGTWITPAMQDAYTTLHRAGVAHSIETWIGGRLSGGLYGIGLGRMFFGESMFTHVADASKIALAYLVNFLRNQGVRWIDCQQETAHLASLGAAPVARGLFLAEVARAVAEPPVHWLSGRLDAQGRLHAASL